MNSRLVKNEIHVGTMLKCDGVTNVKFRAHEDGGLVVADGHSRWYEQCSRGQIFSVFQMTQSGQQNMLGVLNPIGSGINLEILQGWIGWSVSTGAATPEPAQWEGSADNRQITDVASGIKGSCFHASAISRAKSFGSGGITGANTSSIIRPFAAMMSNIVMVAGTDQKIMVDNVDGAIVVPPGCIVRLSRGGGGGSVATGSAGILYAEVSRTPRSQ